MTRRTSPMLAAAMGLLLALAACAQPSSSPASSPTAEPASPSATPSEQADATPGPDSTTAPTAPASGDPTPAPTTDDSLLAYQLTDVRSGETFTLFELAVDHGPVLLEPMAIWCSNCRAQQHQVVAAHVEGDFTSVSLGVDLSELPEDLAVYADREGFDWRFAMADAELYRLLQGRFGTAVTSPPVTPLIVIEADGTVRALEFGVGTRSADQLLAELGQG